ncbi:sulfite exporter TauE/SafE family protein [archaeon]
MKTKRFKASGMHCPSCEKLITKAALKINGVKKASADYATEEVSVTFDPRHTSTTKIFSAIEAKGYECSAPDTDKVSGLDAKVLGAAAGATGLALVAYFVLAIEETIQLPAISHDMGLGLLFLVGLLTGIHCVGMCGGFVVSYTAKSAREGKKPYKPHFMYGLGKTVSYTVIGAGFGLLGSIVAFTPLMRGVAGIIAGLFLIVFGVNMLYPIPVLRRIRLSTPGFVSKFVGKETKQHSSPLVIGLLNGLMIACGPLQAIYIMAAGTGSMVEGAKLLFVFGLGTLPVMLGFGLFASFMSTKMTHKILKASGALVIVFGLLMVNNGLALTGTGFDTNSLVTSASISKGDAPEAPIQFEGDYQVIRMEVNRYGWKPDKFVLKAGVPVKWIIDGKEINGCNNAIQVPKYGLEFDIVRGEQTIEFTPDKEGVISWSCWMGMIPGVFIIKDDIELIGNEVEPEAAEEIVAIVPTPKAGSCGGSCGSPTCGGGTPSGCGCGG